MAIYLGLGANLGDRRANLSGIIEQLARHGIKPRRVSPVFETPALLPPNAPGDWNKPYLNCVVEVETTLSPANVMATTQAIEKDLGRNHNGDRWSPRPADIDILVWHDEVINTPTLTIPHKEMINRAFVLDPLSHLAPSLIIPGQSETVLTLARANSQHQALIMGILNTTADSFSDGGVHDDLNAFSDSVSSWVAAGIPILDIGAESTRPGAKALTPDEEWKKLTPYLDVLKFTGVLKPLLSIDTYHPETAAKALAWGFDIINDVSGLTNPSMRALVSESATTAIAMHSLTVPADKNINLPVDCDPVRELKNWLSVQRTAWDKDGIDPDRIIFDPGIGFNKTAHQSLNLLKHLPDFAGTGLRLLSGHSRKSFMSVFTNHPFADRNWETLGLSLTVKGVDILRVHTPIEHHRAIQAAMHIL